MTASSLSRIKKDRLAGLSRSGGKGSGALWGLPQAARAGSGKKRPRVDPGPARLPAGTGALEEKEATLRGDPFRRSGHLCGPGVRDHRADHSFGLAGPLIFRGFHLGSEKVAFPATTPFGVSEDPG